ncbi:MAG: hypothetical protein ACJ8DZ_02235 [Allosphingosinicella sp.]
MRKFMISAALLSATAMAAPAAAQYAPRAPYGQAAFRGGGLEAQLREIDQRIAAGVQRGLLSRGEANRLSTDVRQLQVRVRGRAWNGLSFRERQNLEARIQGLRVRVDSELREGRGQRRDRRW